ncbi:MAG: hypothetical protein WBA46_10650, partial [Thermomicrobiales bacterium]
MAPLIVPMGLVLALLAGCGSSGSSNVQDDRQFASNAKTAPAEETTPTATAAAPTASSGPSSGSTQTVNPLATRGAPSEAFTWDDSTITIFLMTGTSPSLVTIEGAGADGALIRDVAASPSG